MAHNGVHSTANSLARRVPADEPAIGVVVNDQEFFRELEQLKQLSTFLNTEAVSVGDPAARSLGELYVLQYGKQGRAPTQLEWEELENHTQKLLGALSEPQRRRFVVSEIPLWVAILPMGLAVLAFFALIMAVKITALTPETSVIAMKVMPYYLAWLVSLGAIGAVAFVGMNALSVQHDITFDLTNRKLMLLRIALGALFGLVLTLPFGANSFIQFVGHILWPTMTAEEFQKSFGAPKSEATQALLLLLPFILGFSTSLVITVLNKFVSAAETFFGRVGAEESASAQPVVAASTNGTAPAKKVRHGAPTHKAHPRR